MVRVYSWNVNGYRAALRNGFLSWLEEEKPDIICLQETKARESDIPPEGLAPPGYKSVWHSAKKKGYSGVATFYKVRRKPLSVTALGVDEFDHEGRVQILEYPNFTLLNAYWPNSQPERARLDYKLRFCDAILEHSNRLRDKGKHVILCGDFNIAHKEIDLARPKDNRNNPGFYPEECAFMDKFVAEGYVDTFRHFHPDQPGQYSWWSYRARAREKNIGWRIDYHCVNEEFAGQLKRAAIHADVMGSDHCPVSVTVK